MNFFLKFLLFILILEVLVAYALFQLYPIIDINLHLEQESVYFWTTLMALKAIKFWI